MIKWIAIAIWVGFVLIWFVRNVIFYFSRKPVAAVTDFTRYSDPMRPISFDVPANWAVRHKVRGTIQFRDPNREIGSLIILPSLLPARILSFSKERGSEKPVSSDELSGFVRTQCNERGYQIVSLKELEVDSLAQGCLLEYQRGSRRDKRLVVLFNGWEYNLVFSAFADEFDDSVFDRALATLRIESQRFQV